MIEYIVEMGGRDFSRLLSDGAQSRLGDMECLDLEGRQIESRLNGTPELVDVCLCGFVTVVTLPVRYSELALDGVRTRVEQWESRLLDATDGCGIIRVDELLLDELDRATRDGWVFKPNAFDLARDFLVGDLERAEGADVLRSGVAKKRCQPPLRETEG